MIVVDADGDRVDGPVPILDPDLLRSTLATAMATGGEFAEIFVEERRST